MCVCDLGWAKIRSSMPDCDCKTGVEKGSAGAKLCCEKLEGSGVRKGSILFMGVLVDHKKKSASCWNVIL